jgi:hypothetical protein
MQTIVFMIYFCTHWVSKHYANRDNMLPSNSYVLSIYSSLSTSCAPVFCFSSCTLWLLSQASLLSLHALLSLCSAASGFAAGVTMATNDECGALASTYMITLDTHRTVH